MAEIEEHPFGKPISVLSFTDNNGIHVDNKEIENIFSHPEIQDRKVVILSLIGAFRGGKSFFLDYCLRFLYAHFPSISNPWEEKSYLFEKNDDWMGKPDEPLKGFSWRAGTRRDTTGIIIWSDVFLHTIDRTGEKIAIFVVDTQGLFDNDSTATDNSRIFALGTLISSIQVLNLMNRTQEDQLQYLQFATEMARITSQRERMNEKPFQNLTFLIRDWAHGEDFSYGIEGGTKYFNEEVLKIQSTQKPELKSVRESIRNCFDKIQCCLLPHPGRTVATLRAFDGRWSDMDENFKVELKKVIEYILLPDHLVFKKIGSHTITGKEIKTYIEQYFSLFQSDEAPKTTSLYDQMVESFLKNLKKKQFDYYKATIYKNKEYLNEDTIKLVHELTKSRTLELFDNANKIGSMDHVAKYKQILDDEIEKIFIDFTSERLQELIDAEVRSAEFMLKNQKQKKEETEKDIKKIQNLLEELEEERNEMSLVEYNMRVELLKARLNFEKMKLNDYRTTENDENGFTLQIIQSIGAQAAFYAAKTAAKSFCSIM